VAPVDAECPAHTGLWGSSGLRAVSGRYVHRVLLGIPMVPTDVRARVGRTAWRRRVGPPVGTHDISRNPTPVGKPWVGE